MTTPRETLQRCIKTFWRVAYLSQSQDPPSRWERLRTVPSGAWHCHPGHIAGGWAEERQRYGEKTTRVGGNKAKRHYIRNTRELFAFICLVERPQQMTLSGRNKLACKESRRSPWSLQPCWSGDGEDPAIGETTAVPERRARQSGSQHGENAFDKF